MSDGERMGSDQLFSLSHKVRTGNKQKAVVSYSEQLIFDNSCCRILCMLKIHMAESNTRRVHGGEIYQTDLVQAI